MQNDTQIRLPCFRQKPKIIAGFLPTFFPKRPFEDIGKLRYKFRFLEPFLPVYPLYAPLAALRVKPISHKLA